MSAAPLRTTARRLLGETHAAATAITPGIALPEPYARVYLHHLRKTGGTSMQFAFYQLATDTPERIEHRLTRNTFTRVGRYRFVANNVHLITKGSFFFASSHFPLHVARPPAQGTFRLTILRDPVERVVSLYRYLADPLSDDGFRNKAPAEERKWAADGYDRFLDRIPQFDLLNQLFSFSRTGSTDEAVQEIQALDLIMHTRQLVEEAPVLSGRLNLPLTLGHRRAGVSPVSLTDSQLDRTREMTAPEYTLLRQLSGIRFLERR